MDIQYAIVSTVWIYRCLLGVLDLTPTWCSYLT